MEHPSRWLRIAFTVMQGKITKFFQTHQILPFRLSGIFRNVSVRTDRRKIPATASFYCGSMRLSQYRPSFFER